MGGGRGRGSGRGQWEDFVIDGMHISDVSSPAANTYHSNRLSSAASPQAAATVAINPPKNPSHVFLGDSLIKGVRPKKKPIV